MTLRINDIAPDFEAETTQGRIRFHEFIGDSWCVLFSHPEGLHARLHHRTGLHGRHCSRSSKSATARSSASASTRSPITANGPPTSKSRRATKSTYPMIGDSDLNVAKLYGMLPAEAGDTCAGRTAANNATVRTVFVIGPDKKIKLMLIYPMTTGRNFDEVLRVLDSMQLTAKHQVATPVNWKPGDDVIIVPCRVQ